MRLIDTHSHINEEQFAEDISDVIHRAESTGLSHIIAVGTDLKSSENCVRLADDYPMVYATAGIHPHEADKSPSQYLNELENFLSHPKVVAIGEIGLDYHYNFSPAKIQIKRFREQLEFAENSGLPVVVHNRESEDDLLSQIRESGNRYGVIHSFSGNIEFAERILDLDYYISFTGMVSFVKQDLPDVVKWIDNDRYMIETDSPYLAPKPHRGKRNEPAFVKYIAETIAGIRHEPVETVAGDTVRNTLRFFRKLPG